MLSVFGRRRELVVQTTATALEAWAESTELSLPGYLFSVVLLQWLWNFLRAPLVCFLCAHPS